MMQLDPSFFTHHPPLVLVADDEKNTAKMLETIFERVGFQIECAYNGIDALDRAKLLLPDLILLDVMMPGLNGFDVLKGLREFDATRNIPTIIVTAQAREPEDLERGLNLGADDFLYKPFNPHELIARAQSKMRNRKLEEDLERRSRELEQLLGVSAQLNQTPDLHSLLDLVPPLLLDLLPGSATAIYVFGEDGSIIDQRLQVQQKLRAANKLQDSSVIKKLFSALNGHIAQRWTGNVPELSAIPACMVTALVQGDSTLGMLLIVGDEAYDDRQLRLFSGIASQTALALRNAQLYDITARHALELEARVLERTRELEQAQQLLLRQEKLASIGHLAASIAHEINNPLMPIRNLLDDHLEEISHSNVDYDRKAMELIQDSLERIRRIVSRLLDFTGKRNEGLALIDVGPILESIVDLNRKFFATHNVTIEADIPTLPPIYGSKDQLEQVFMNLALNAQAAMSKGGTLKISAQQIANAIAIEFEDNGSGIAPEHIDRIFDPFFSTKPNGTGLGLFVSYGIIEGHNGEIDVKSTVNKGTTFTVLLPIHESESG
jgi:signal transduction histidine kinase/FixJ family two-component response regulator